MAIELDKAPCKQPTRPVGTKQDFAEALRAMLYDCLKSDALGADETAEICARTFQAAGYPKHLRRHT